MSKHAQLIEAVAEQIANIVVRRIAGKSGSSLKRARILSVSRQATDCIVSNNVRTINQNELKALYALLALLSYHQPVGQEEGRAIVERKFGAAHIMQLNSKDYDNAVRFLLNLKLDDIYNQNLGAC